MEEIGLLDMAVIIAAYGVVGGSVLIWVKGSKIRGSSGRVVDSINQHIVMLLWMLLLVFFVYVGGGFLAHQDASWHQLAHSDDEVMPAQMIIYLFLYPGYMVIGGIAWLYAKIHFGDSLFSRKLKGALILATFIPFLFLPAQNPAAMGFSVDLIDTFFRAGYGLMMFIWLLAVGYIVAQQGLAILSLLKEAGAE